MLQVRVPGLPHLKRADTRSFDVVAQGRAGGVSYLVTGGAGFIGSHLADALTARGGRVVILDDLSTGRVENIEHLSGSGRAELVEGSVMDEGLVVELLEATDACVHLASAVGVKLVVDRPVETLLQNVRGTDTVLSAAASLGRRVLFTSTSEIYGKTEGAPLSEGSDRVVGSTTKARWNYSTSKAFGEALALGYHRDLGAPNVVVRLFNTVGPRQTGAYGMVLPRFVRQALAGEDLTVYGEGTQTRCFGHVYDTVEALLLLLDSEAASGRVFNIGNPVEISIRELAERVISRVGSGSAIRFVPYADAYDEGFEELGRRIPDTAALRELTGWAPTRSIGDAIDDVIMFERAADLHLYTGNSLPAETDPNRLRRSRQGGAQVGR
jgi:UDP-glucose 4-epimerase